MTNGPWKSQLVREPAGDRRSLRTETLSGDLAVVGGGIAGVCCAVTAAREGLRVVLINDRPVLGGNASSEVRLWILGATAHMGNNNRWAREGGVIDELLVENMYRNPEGNTLIFDTILLEAVVNEPNIRLLLNTSVYEVTKKGSNRVDGVRAFCSQNSTTYDVSAPLFCDASGDGIVGFLSGAAFRMGAESRDEFGELLAPDHGYGSLLGHSLYFYTKDVGRPVKFVPPSFALRDISEIPRYRQFNTKEHGCQLWWIEYGGRMDTVHDTEEIKWELWRIVYGVWNHIKNSGEFPEAESLTLEWVGQIPGKRESRRFEGDYMLTQHDLVEQRVHRDAVSYGGWAIDLHPADGVYSEMAPCNQWHSKGVYQIPYRTLYSRNIENMFLAGRLISASHVAFGSTRVMATCGHNAQAVAMAAALCHEHGYLPRQLAAPGQIERLQERLQRSGQFIPNVVRPDREDLAQRATVTASSRLKLAELEKSGAPLPLSASWAMLLPVRSGPVPRVTFSVSAGQPVDLLCELRGASKVTNFTPDVVLAQRVVRVGSRVAPVFATPHTALRTRALAGSSTRRDGNEPQLLRGAPDEGGRIGDGAAGDGSSQTDSRKVITTQVEIDFDVAIEADGYVFVCLQANPHVTVHQSDAVVSGILALRHGTDRRVAHDDSQLPEDGIGIDAFELWCPQRRPKGRNLAIRIEPALDCFGPENVLNGIARPTTQPNAWVADWDDPAPRLTLTWPHPQKISRIELSFDTDFDHPMESALMGHLEYIMPQCVRRFRILDDAHRVLTVCDDNHQTRRVIRLEQPVDVSQLHIEIEQPSEHVPAALFEVRCYES